MKDLIKRLQKLGRDSAGNYGMPIATEAADALEQQAAVIEQMRDALRVIRLKCDPKYGWPIIGKALALQPCPEVLNKVRADTVRKFGVAYGREYKEAIILPFTEHYARRIENGEA